MRNTHTLQAPMSQERGRPPAAWNTGAVSVPELSARERRAGSTHAHRRSRAAPEAAYFAHRLLQSLHRHVGRFSLLGWRSLDFGRVEFVHQLHGEGGEMRTLGVWKQRGCRLLEAGGNFTHLSWT